MLHRSPCLDNQVEQSCPPGGQGRQGALFSLPIMVSARRSPACIRGTLVRVSTEPAGRVRELLPDRWKAERDAANREVAAAVHDLPASLRPGSAAPQSLTSRSGSPILPAEWVDAYLGSTWANGTITGARYRPVLVGADQRSMNGEPSHDYHTRIASAHGCPDLPASL